RAAGPAFVGLPAETPPRVRRWRPVEGQPGSQCPRYQTRRPSGPHRTPPTSCRSSQLRTWRTGSPTAPRASPPDSTRQGHVRHLLTGTAGAREGREAVEPVDRRAQVRGAQVRVAEGHLEIGVPEDLLHFLEARPAHYQVARCGVPEIVEAEGLDTRALKGRREGRPDLAPGGAIPAGEHEPLALRRLGLEGHQGVVHRPVDWDAAGLAALRPVEREP